MGISIKDFLQQESNGERLSKLFYNMSVTMKYIHTSNYYIDQFDLSSITIENPDSLTPINYQKIQKMSPQEENEVTYQNIFLLALLQVGVYTNTLSFLNPQFVRQNFNEFEIFLPPEDVPYLRGVIERKSPVYYCDYVNERVKRDINKLEEETGMKENSGIGTSKTKATAVGKALADKETRKLYGDLDDKQAAFTTFLILPLTMILLGLVISIIVLFMH